MTPLIHVITGGAGEPPDPEVELEKPPPTEPEAKEPPEGVEGEGEQLEVLGNQVHGREGTQTVVQHEEVVETVGDQYQKEAGVGEVKVGDEDQGHSSVGEPQVPQVPHQPLGGGGYSHENKDKDKPNHHKPSHDIRSLLEPSNSKSSHSFLKGDSLSVGSPLRISADRNLKGTGVSISKRKKTRSKHKLVSDNEDIRKYFNVSVGGVKLNFEDQPEQTDINRI